MTNEEFLSVYKTFEMVDAPFITQSLQMSEMLCPLSVWKQKQSLGIMLHTAHLLTMDWMQKAEIAGAATSLASGQSGRSPSAVQDDLDLTTYGRQFKLLRRSIPTFGISY